MLPSRYVGSILLPSITIGAHTYPKNNQATVAMIATLVKNRRLGDGRRNPRKPEYRVETARSFDM